MVLPLLPVIDTFDRLESKSGQLTSAALTAIGQVLYNGKSTDLAQTLAVISGSSIDVVVDIHDFTLDETIQVLDAGAARVIVTKGQLGDLKDIPAERLIVRLTEEDVATPAGVEEVASSVAGIIIDSTFTISVDPESLKSIVSSVQKNYLPSGGNRTVYLEYSETIPPTIPELKSLALLSIEPILPAAYLTSSHKDFPHLLSVSQVALLGAKTDRPDGLYSTVVTDERGHALGLVYSSADSIAESIRSGQGVYQSRERGLWYKGATSGATQQVLGISWDCDADCLRFVVRQAGKGFCHLDRQSCFGPATGLSALEQTLQSRKQSAPKGSYVARLFSDPSLLRSKIVEEAEEVCDASTPKDIAWEVADLLFFAMTKCVANGVSLAEVEAQLDRRARKISRRKGDAKPKWSQQNGVASESTVVENAKEMGDAPGQMTLPPAALPSAAEETKIKMRVYTAKNLSPTERKALLSRPIQKTDQIMPIVQDIINNVRKRGDPALLEYTAKFEKAKLSSPVLKAPFPAELMDLSEKTKRAIDTAFENIRMFHAAQMDSPKHVETMAGITCSRFARPIERVGLYVPGGTAVLPSTAMMLGVPALVAGCKSIQFATPPRADGSVVPEIVYIASKVGAKAIVLAGGAQAVAALAYGTQSVEKVDKIFGPGNQFVTAAKMAVQSDSSALAGVDLPAGPSEVLVVADSTANPKFVASDLLSQAEHGADSMVVLVAVDLSPAQLKSVEDEIHRQASLLPRGSIVIKALANSYVINFDNLTEAMDFTNDYAPEHLILYTSESGKVLDLVQNAGSVFVGAWSPVSCGDYASGTNHTLPTYGFAKMYSGVNTGSFQKHITSQELTPQGLKNLGPTVITLAEVEGLDAHAESIRVRMAELGIKM